ncbi:hypothetical protein EON66_06095 [archaeon]|nr:MAG: hypothetical protein EON66_06095 [archaeon]
MAARKAALTPRPITPPTPRRMLRCVCCPAVHTWDAYNASATTFHVHAEIVYAVPNDASRPLYNVVGGTIVLAKRGGASIPTKAVHAQRAGALALLIVDDGSCGDAFECGGWLGSKADHPDGFIVAHELSAWQQVRIPVALIAARDGARLDAALRLTYFEHPHHGQQVSVP